MGKHSKTGGQPGSMALIKLYTRDGFGDSTRTRGGATFDTTRHIGAHVPEDVPEADDWELCPCVRSAASKGGGFKARAKCKSCNGVGYVLKFAHTRARR